MANVSTIVNSGSLYEQLIRQVISVEAQPRLKLVERKTEQGVYKGILSDFASRASALNTLAETLRTRSSRRSRRARRPSRPARASPPRRPMPRPRATTRSASASSRAPTRASRAGPDHGRHAPLAARFSDRRADPPAPAERRFTIHVAQPTGDPVSLDVRYTPPEARPMATCSTASRPPSRRPRRRPARKAASPTGPASRPASSARPAGRRASRSAARRRASAAG